VSGTTTPPVVTRPHHQRGGTPEHREMRIGEDLPADLHAEQMRFLLAGPGPEEVSGTEQLGAYGVLEHDFCPRLGEAVEIQRCAELRVEIEQRAGT
jgi:hypothetical protein